jgi:hypothetical protein
MEYSGHSALSEVLLENSWVLSVTASSGTVKFEMDLVLLPAHAQYRQPIHGEHFCYRQGLLTIQGIERLEWSEMGRTPATDATGKIDWGHIDAFEMESGEWALAGDWGAMRLSGSALTVALNL